MVSPEYPHQKSKESDNQEANTRPNMPNMAKYAYLGVYLGARNMVKWGVPEKILQNAVRTRHTNDSIIRTESMTGC